MKHLRIDPVPMLAIALALLRGAGEFAALQRWRLKSWIAR